MLENGTKDESGAGEGAHGFTCTNIYTNFQKYLKHQYHFLLNFTLADFVNHFQHINLTLMVDCRPSKNLKVEPFDVDI